jgi:hypothetical protein
VQTERGLEARAAAEVEAALAGVADAEVEVEREAVGGEERGEKTVRAAEGDDQAALLDFRLESGVAGRLRAAPAKEAERADLDRGGLETAGRPPDSLRGA